MNETARTAVEQTDHKAAEPAAGLIEVRGLAYADLPIVISIERRSFPSPWSVGMFALEMSKPGTVALAAIDGDRVAGYMVLSRFDRAWHLMNIAVAPEQRRRGIASLLIEEALGRIAEDEPVTLEVRPSNRSAIELYQGFGFRSLGLRPGYYPDNGEDALIMWRGDPRLAGVPVEDLPGA
ncbi:MAG: ribosomal protein S18-alanine N-acetyltransferase [Solirubrobacterales bacterium]|nr:ribosomal protein S18-alanine N-acetyltransferase [Solirubrobacterales bacterium]